jgi:hypothetical protein
MKIKVKGYETTAMIDSGAQGNFISPNLVNKLELLWKEKDELYKLVTVNESLMKYQSDNVNIQTFSIPFDICRMKYMGYFDIMEISKHDIILGIPWLRASNPKINWKTGQI